jgi:hypothetical protein
MTHDGLSRCECCDRVTPADRLVHVTGIVPYPALAASLCRECNSLLGELEQQFRAPQTLAHIRAARAKSPLSL